VYFQIHFTVLGVFQVVAAVIAYRYRNQFDPDDKGASAIISRHHSNYMY
jgi:hypothetical protein